MKEFKKLTKAELKQMTNEELRNHIKWCEDVSYIDMVLGIILSNR